MKGEDGLLDALAALVDYPGEEFAGQLRQCRALARALAPPVATALDRFSDEIALLPLARLQEAYIEAFDLDPACSLDLGWHLYGDRRERGGFLLALRERLRGTGVVESTQLPDHLTHVLALLARQPEAERAALAVDCVTALERVGAALRRRESPYAALIEAVHGAASGGVTVPKGSTP